MWVGVRELHFKVAETSSIFYFYLNIYIGILVYIMASL